MVMVKCPQTGHAIPTGIKTDRESFARSAVFSRAPVARFAAPITPGSRAKPGSPSRASGSGAAARSPWRKRRHRSAMGDTMARMQIPTETSTWLLQAKEFLYEARRLKPGPERNDLRQTAKVLREIARLEAASEPAPGRDWRQRTGSGGQSAV
jgi:hypothetical protein